jgi:phage/plasmid-associated DNA primase
METIKALIAQGFSLVNVNEEKHPIGNSTSGFGLDNWNKLTYDELKTEHNYKVNRWGIKLGRHENERRLVCFDFDIFRKDTPDSPCPIATKELEIYLADVGEENADGMFWDSTEGNVGLLVDITDNEFMCAGIDTLVNAGKSKGDIGGMEIFYGDDRMKVIPPTATTCKKAKKVMRARKYMNEHPICILDNSPPNESAIVMWMCGHIKTLIGELGATKLPKSKTSASAILTPPNSRTATPALPLITDDKYTALLKEKYMGNPKNESGRHKITRTYFIKICAVLKCNGYDPQVWRDFIAIDRRGGDGMKTWDSIDYDIKDNPIACLKTIAKIINPEGFNKWKADFHAVLPYETLMKGENDIAKFLEFHLSPHLRCFQKLWYMFDEQSSLWIKTDTPTSFIITSLQQLIDDATAMYGNLKRDENDETKKIEYQKKIEKYLDYRRKCCGSKIYSALERFLKTELKVNKDWCKRFDNNPYQIAYKNGMFDLKTGKFTEGLLASHYLTKTLPFDYEPPNEADVKWLREQLKKICNYDEIHLHRYLSQLGYMLCGDPSRVQEFYNFKGEKAGNGKSTILDALCEIMPNYCKKLNGDTFEKRAKSEYKKTIAVLCGIRIAWLNEVDASAPQDEGEIKTIRDGKGVSYNEMYGVNLDMKISCKLIFVGNNGLKVKGDAGIMRSMVINQFDSEFSNEVTEDDTTKCIFKADDKFCEKLIEKKHSLLALFYEYSKMYCEEGKMKPIPKEWMNEKKETGETLAKFDKWFDRNYEWVEGKDVGDYKKEKDTCWSAWIDDIEDHAKMDKVNLYDIKCELKRMKLWNTPITYDSQARSNKKKGLFRNLRMREYKDDDEDPQQTQDC